MQSSVTCLLSCLVSREGRAVLLLGLLMVGCGSACMGCFFQLFYAAVVGGFLY